MTIHVDDLKIAGEPEVVQQILKELESQFGELTVQRGTFTNCGVQHEQDPQTLEVKIDQIDFAGALRTVEHPQLQTGALEEKCVPELHQLYMSLLWSDCISIAHPGGCDSVHCCTSEEEP